LEGKINSFASAKVVQPVVAVAPSTSGNLDVSGLESSINNLQVAISGKADLSEIEKFRQDLSSKAEKASMQKELDRLDRNTGDNKRQVLTLEERLSAIERETK